MHPIIRRPLVRFTVGALVAVAAATAVPDGAQADSRIYQEALRSTTWVLAKSDKGTSSGSGVLIDAERKLVVSNHHVVGETRNVVVFFPALDGSGRPVVDRKHYLENVAKIGIKGVVIAVDRQRDLSLIELAKVPDGAKAIEMAAESVGPGEAVHSIGNPGASGALWVYTSGTVRAVYKKQFKTGAGEHEFMVVETQSPINSGDSGGPVVDGSGRLVAISQAISRSGNLFSYNVDISEVRAFLNGPWKPAPLPLADVLKQTELEYTRHESGPFEIQFEEGKQKQSVFIEAEIENYSRADVRRVWSLALTMREAPTQEVALKLLQQTARTKLGGWAVERTERGDYLVIFSVKVDATATPDVVKSTMEYAAKITAAARQELDPPRNEIQDAGDTLDKWLRGE